MELIVDREIAAVIPEPAPVLESDKPETGEDANLFAGPLDRKKLWLDSLRSGLERSKRFDPKVPVVVWKSKRIIIDGIERYKLCRQLRIKPVLELMEFASREEAIRERWARNVQTVRYLS